MENKHKHYEMIVAKAANMDLVVFEKDQSGWLMRKTDILHMNPDKDYFLCLPQHKETCLHWLNGGEVEWGNAKHEQFDWYPKDGIGINELSVDVGYFIDESFLIRIKPKKEKRWIVAGENSLHTMTYFESRELAEAYDTQGCDRQVIEIEV